MILKAVLLAALGALPVYSEDKAPELAATKAAQLETIAAAVAEAASENARRWPGPQRELAALMLTVAWHESALSLRIHRGECRAWECDRGRARGIWQMHERATSSREAWLGVVGLDSQATRLAAREAARALVRARRQCRSLEKRGGDWLTLTLTAYARGTCLGAFKGLEKRAATFKRLVRLAP